MRPPTRSSRPTRALSRAAPFLGFSFALLASADLTGPALAQQAPTPDPLNGDPVQVPEVVVTGTASGLRGYLAPETSTALRLPVPIQDVPVSVQVVPDTLIQDRAALTVRQAVETVSGVTSSNAIPGSVALRIRGFNDGSANLRDGFRETSNQQDVQGIERIDVLTRDNRLPVGDVLAGVARHAGQIWTTYEFGEGSPLRGIGIGGGVRAERRREATLPNTFTLPAYARLDAAAWYRFEVSRTPLRAQVNVQNINHQRIYDTDGSNTLRVNVPFTVLASLTAQF